MLHSTGPWPTDHLARAQFHMLNQLGDAMNLAPDDRRRALDLSDRDWTAWNEFLLRRRTLPACPPLPDMLQRLAKVSFNLAVVAEIGAGREACR